MAFLVQMRQSNKCGILGNDEIINLHLGSGAGLESASPASCKTPATFIDSTHPNNQAPKNKESRQEVQLPANWFVLPWPTHKEPRAKRDTLGTQP